MVRWLLAVVVACGPIAPAPQEPPAYVEEVVEEAPPPAPTARPAHANVDGALPFPEYAWWVGATETEAVVLFGSRTARMEYFAVTDLETGCLTETYARFPTVWRALNTTWFRTELTGKRAPDAIDMSSPTFADELAGMIAWLGRFAVRRLPGKMAWSADGTRILFATTDWMFRSRDGGRTLLRVDGAPSYEPDVSADGRWGAYRRCDNRTGRCKYKVALVPLDADRTSIAVGDEGVKDLRFDGGRILYARESRGQLCVDRADIASRRVTNVACARTEVRSEDAFFVSPNARFGAVEIVNKLDPPKSGLRLLSLADGRVLGDIHGTRAAAPPIDDLGRLAWPEGVAPTWRVHVADAAGDRVIGEGDPLGFDARGRVVVRTGLVGPTSTQRLGNPACGLVKALPAERGSPPARRNP